MSGFAGFVLLPIYLVLALVIVVKGQDLFATAEVPAPVEAGMAELGVEREELFFTQSGFGRGRSKPASFFAGWTAPEEARWNECFDELYVGAGDRSVYEQQVMRARGKTRGYFGIDPEDIVVEALTKVCRSHASKEKRDLTPYFVTSVSNAIVDIERKKARGRCKYSVPDLQAPEPREADKPAPSVEAVLCELSEMDQEILRLDLAEYTGPQIADELRISHAAARKRLERARERFKEAWFAAARELDQEN